jgi:hypothetical protein
MELLDGHTLKHLVEAKPLDTDRIVQLGIEIADALDAAPRSGHRASRHQTREHLRDRARSREGSRLRPGEGRRRGEGHRNAGNANGRRHAVEPWSRARHGGVHVSRTGTGRGHGRAHRSVLARPRALRNGHRPTGVRALDDGRHDRRHSPQHTGGACAAESASTRRAGTHHHEVSREGSRASVPDGLGDSRRAEGPETGLRHAPDYDCHGPCPPAAPVRPHRRRCGG